MASATIHGKFDLDLRGKKVEGLAAATANGEAVRYEQIQNLTGHNVIVGTELSEGETLTIPSENWLVLPNSVKHYLYYNHTDSAKTITAPVNGYTLAQIAAFIASDGTLTLINSDVDISGKQDQITEYAFETAYVVGDTVYSLGELFECRQNITSHAELRPQNLPATVWKPITTHIEVIDTLAALRLLNETGEAIANISAGELFAVHDDTDANNGIYRVTSTGSTGTVVSKVAGLGGSIPADVPRQQNISVTSGSTVTNGGTVSASGAITVNVNTPESGVDVEETFPLTAPLGHQIFLDPAGNAVTVVDSNGHRRPRGFYSYIQPLSNPNSRYWEQITIPEVPELYNNAREADLIYLTDAEDDFNTIGNNFTAGFYRAGPTSANAQTWIATGGTTGSMVEVNGIKVHNADFRAHELFGQNDGHLYSPVFRTDDNVTTSHTDVSIQIDTLEIANAIGLPSLQAQVHQIEEELSHPGTYTWADEDIFTKVFITNETNSSGTSDQSLILQPHFTDNTDILTVYAVLTGDADSGDRNEWNGFNSTGAGVVVGLGPDVSDLIAFQLVSTYYRDNIVQGLAEVHLKLLQPDAVFTGPSSISAGVTTNKQQFISWSNAGNVDKSSPIVHQGISTYYYETNNAFLDTVRHDLGSHIEGSSLTPDERVIIDNLLVPMINVPTTIPGGPNLTTFAADASQSGSADSGGWYWRNAQTGSAAVTPDPTDWADLVQGDGVSNANSDEWHVLICRPADTAQAALVENIAGSIGFKIANTGGTVTSNNLGSLFVSDGTTDNFAELEVVVSPTSQTSTTQDVRFRIKRVIQSRGVPPVNQTVTISDAGITVNVPTRSGDPSFQENLDITGNLDVTGTTNGADTNAIAYVAIQLSASVPQEFTPTGAVADHTYLRYTARYNGAEAVLVDDINTGADPVTSTTYVNFVSVASPGTEIPQQ